MARFHPLTVARIRPTIREAVEVTLVPSDAGAFAFRPGQHLTFRRRFDGAELRRSYSICAGLDDGALQVGVKRVPGGAFSTFVNEDLRAGDVLEALPPSGSFVVDPDPAARRRILAFAGGSGITPILSILRSVLGREPRSHLTLVYANRGVRSIMFREELEDLKNRYMDRFALVHVLEEDAPEIELFAGRLSEAKCAALFRHWVDPARADLVLLCGPSPMMEAVGRALAGRGVAPERVKRELFRPDQPGRAARPAARTVEAAGRGARIRITLDGATRLVEALPGQTILEAALAAALDVPYSCRAGVCSTCRCRLTEGRAEMAANHALEDDEVARGALLSCQARPLTDSLAVDYDSR